MRATEQVTLHFDLSHCPSDAAFTLNAGAGKHYTLTRYADAPGKLAEHRQRNKALALIPEHQLHRLTHFVEDAELPADGATRRTVTYPSTRPDALLPEIALIFIHVPGEHRRRAQRRMQARAVALPPNKVLQYYGVEPHAISAAEDHDVRVDAGRVLPPFKTAEAIVFHHPEIGSVNPALAHYILEKHVVHTQDFSDLSHYISTNPPGSATSWYQQTTAIWVDPDTGKEGPCPANDDLVDRKGNKVKWPQQNGQSVIPQYQLSDEFNSQDAGVLGKAAPVVHQVLIDTKNDEYLNGQLWTKQNGTTERTQTRVQPEPRPSARLTADVGAGLGAAPKGWTVKNQTSSYGLDLYPDDLAFDRDKQVLSFPVKNWPNRYLSAYVAFVQTDGSIIPRDRIPGWYQWSEETSGLIDDELRKKFEFDPNKSYLTYLSSGNQVFGIPFPTDPVTLEMLWPQEASKAEVLIGGLGVAEGLKDFDPAVDVIGMLGTGLINYGFTAASLAFSVAVVGPWLKSLNGSKRKYIVYAVAGAIGVTAFIYGIVEWKASTGKMVLAKLANFAASTLFGKLVALKLQASYIQTMGEITGEYMSFTEAEEALEEIPYAGWILQVASVASDIASLLATTVECVLSPATYRLEVVRTLDLTVTVTPDPAHGKPGEKPIWPLVSDHYVIQVTYPAAGNEQGGTTFTKAGPMPGDHTAPIVVTFSGIPAGGMLNVVANIYSDNNWLAGRWGSGWLNATPDSTDQLTAGGSITENLVPLTATTSYSQKQRVLYDARQEKHIWQVTAFSIDAALASDLDGKTVSAALRAAFQSNGNTLSQDNQITIAVVTAGSAWTLTDNGAAITFDIKKVQIYSDADQTLYELHVQNTTNASPGLPPKIDDCGTDGDNHNICKRVGMTYNNKEYELGYTWQASGQNLPRDEGTTRDNGQMYAFQAISTLGEPEDQIIEPTRGFSQQPYLAFDQFGQTPLFYLPLSPYQAELNAGGPLPADLAKAFAGTSVPAGAQIAVVTRDQEWTIGVPGSDPLYTLKTGTVTVSGKTQTVINVFAWPVPAVDNYWLDPRTYAEDQRYYLRGVTFPPGKSTFDYSSGKSWGAFTQANLNALDVHPHGYAVAVDYDNHKLHVLKLPAEAVDDAEAPLAMPLSGRGLREGLMYQPVAMTIAADGRILVLEQGNQRIQAFDVKGNPVPSFAGPLSFTLPAGFSAELDARSISLDLQQAYQRSVTPVVAPLLTGVLSSVSALNSGTVDDVLRQEFKDRGYELPDDPGQITIAVTQSGALWLLTDAVKSVTYDVRVVTHQDTTQDLDVYYSANLSVVVRASGQEWLLKDTTNALTFDIKKPAATGSGASTDLAVQQLISTMALREQSGSSVTYLDVAAESKGYIYVLASATTSGGRPVFQLDIYNPDGSPLLSAPQTGVNAARLAVDQWRTLFTLNYERILGPGTRTEPSVSAWIPSTPGKPSGS